MYSFIETTPGLLKRWKTVKWIIGTRWLEEEDLEIGIQKNVFSNRTRQQVDTKDQKLIFCLLISLKPITFSP